MAGVRQPRRRPGMDAHAGDRPEALLAPVAQRRGNGRRARAAPVGHRGRGAEADDRGDVRGRGAAAAFLRAAHEPGEERRVTAHDERRRPHRAVELRGARHVVGAAPPVDRDLAHRLHGVAEERHPALPAAAATAPTGCTVPTSLLAKAAAPRARSRGAARRATAFEQDAHPGGRFAGPRTARLQRPYAAAACTEVLEARRSRSAPGSRAARRGPDHRVVRLRAPSRRERPRAGSHRPAAPPARVPPPRRRRPPSPKRWIDDGFPSARRAGQHRRPYPFGERGHGVVVEVDAGHGSGILSGTDPALSFRLAPERIRTVPLRHLAVLLALLLLAAAAAGGGGGGRAAAGRRTPPAEPAPQAARSRPRAPSAASAPRRTCRRATGSGSRRSRSSSRRRSGRRSSPWNRSTSSAFSILGRSGPYPDTARNEFRDQWELRVSEARAEFGNLEASDRARHLLLNGLPPNRIRSNCSQLLWPLEVWIYPPSERVREVLVLVFVQQWGVGRPRLWQPFDGLAAIVQAPALSGVSGSVLSQCVVYRRCRSTGDQPTSCAWVRWSIRRCSRPPNGGERRATVGGDLPRRLDRPPRRGRAHRARRRLSDGRRALSSRRRCSYRAPPPAAPSSAVTPPTTSCSTARSSSDGAASTRSADSFTGRPGKADPLTFERLLHPAPTG